MDDYEGPFGVTELYDSEDWADGRRRNQTCPRKAQREVQPSWQEDVHCERQLVRSQNLVDVQRLSST